MSTKKPPRIFPHQPPAERRTAIIRLMERDDPLCGLSARTAFQRWLALIESALCCPIEGCGRLVPDHDCDATHQCHGNEDCTRMCRISLRLVAIGRAEQVVAAYEAGDRSAALARCERATPQFDEKAGDA
jgi:hypothetical protein